MVHSYRKCFAATPFKGKPLKPMIALHRSDSPTDIIRCPSSRKIRLFPKASAKVPFSQNREPTLKMLCVTYKLSRLYHCLWQSQKQYVFYFYSLKL